jgi:hypothetical protein
MAPNPAVTVRVLVCIVLRYLSCIGLRARASDCANSEGHPIPLQTAQARKPTLAVSSPIQRHGAAKACAKRDTEFGEHSEVALYFAHAVQQRPRSNGDTSLRSQKALEAHPALSAIPVCFNLTSFDHLVGKPQQCGRDRETQRPCRLEINDHFELSGLNDR